MPNPLLEQKALAAGEALARLTDREVISIEGADRLTWLNSILSQELRGLSAGESAEALQLDPQGHIEYVLHLVEDGDRTWAIVESATVEPLVAWFDKMIFRSNVEILRHPELSVYFGIGTNFGVTWVDQWPNVVAGGVRYATETPEFKGREHILAEAPAVELVPMEAAEALRIAAHRPRQVTEVDERSLPHELDWLSTAVHLRKGCYRGQETVAKVHNLGHPPRRLTFLHLDGSNHLLPEETEVTLDGKVVGRVTSVAQHYEMGPIALAVLSRSTPADATLMVGRVAASQEVIVPADAGKAANLPPRSELNQRR
ncbi:MAG: folate-binding protein [Rhodoluna sp.]|nr:folate-binding protein [Rhodoluna sp.]